MTAMGRKRTLLIPLKTWRIVGSRDRIGEEPDCERQQCSLGYGYSYECPLLHAPKLTVRG